MLIEKRHNFAEEIFKHILFTDNIPILVHIPWSVIFGVQVTSSYHLCLGNGVMLNKWQVIIQPMMTRFIDIWITGRQWVKEVNQ